MKYSFVCVRTFPERTTDEGDPIRIDTLFSIRSPTRSPRYTTVIYMQRT